MIRRFVNRRDAGVALAQAMVVKAPLPGALVLALPRGGVPVAYEVAKRLSLPLDVLVVRKVGLPSNPELAIGAVASGGAIIRNAEVIRAYGIGDESFDRVVQKELKELDRREKDYRQGQPPLNIRDRAILLIDDGVATGSTMTAAIRALRQMGASSVAVAVPVAAPDSLLNLEKEADAVLCLDAPAGFASVGSFYDDFQQVGDEAVRHLLNEARGA